MNRRLTKTDIKHNLLKNVANHRASHKISSTDYFEPDHKLHFHEISETHSSVSDGCECSDELLLMKNTDFKHELKFVL